MAGARAPATRFLDHKSATTARNAAFPESSGYVSAVTTPPPADNVPDTPDSPPAWAPPDAPEPAASTEPPTGLPEPPPEAESPAGSVPRRTNTLAVVALVTALLGLVLLGIGFAVAALVQTGRRGEKGRGLAIAALAASVVWLAAAAGTAAVLGGSVFSPGSRGSDPSRPDGYVLPSTLKVGDCFTAKTHDSADPLVFPSACDHPHNGEVIAKATLPAGPYPGASKLAEQAGAVCKEHVPDKVKDVIDADFDPRAGVPGREDWNDGKREVTCMLVYVGKNNTLTTPIAGAYILPRTLRPVNPGDCMEKWVVYGGQPLVECTDEHRVQVLAIFEIRGKDYPGKKAIEEIAIKGCAERGAAIWKGAPPPLDLVDFAYVTPTKASWRSGDREVTCLLEAREGTLRRSLVPAQ
ncbi:Septum formation [Actinomadura madurae]|uniref:Septum formation n=1 Tax=Actinomadura madurae TaxID=1993 RepID=A0A1I4WM48_9ACTN|nr:Septum formation [Actinomadura madurae]